MEIKRPKQPCAKKCPGRSAECKKTCEKWLEYEALKMEFYKARGEYLEQQRVLNEMDLERKIAVATGKMQRRRTKNV